MLTDIRDFKQTDVAAVIKRISIQKDSRPSEFSQPLTSITLKLNETASSWPPHQLA